MAKVTSWTPDLARQGRFGPLVFQKWKSLYVVRRKPHPAYHNTENDQRVRTKFAAAVLAYQQLDEITRMLWRVAAYGTGMSGYESFLRFYIKNNP